MLEDVGEVPLAIKCEGLWVDIWYCRGNNMYFKRWELKKSTY